MPFPVDHTMPATAARAPETPVPASPAPESPAAAAPAPFGLVALPLILVLGAFAVIVQKMAKPIDNADTYFHLRLGREFLEGWSPRDPGSVTRFATADWLPTQWLGQMGLAKFEEWFGLPGAVWLSGAMVLTFALVLFLVARRRSSLVVASFIVPVAVVAASPNLSGRPQVASYLIIALVTAAWMAAGRNGRVPWWIIPVTWLWAMVHGMWSIGVLISLIAVLGIALERRTPRGAVLRMLVVPVGSVVAASLTPMGLGIFTSSARVGAISKYFAEWGPTQFTLPHAAVAALMLVAVLGLALRSGPVPWLEFMLLLLAGAWLVYSVRTVPVAVTMLVPLLAARLGRVVPRRAGWRLELPVILGGFVLALVSLALIVAQTSADPINPDNRAEASVHTLADGTGVLNEWKDGGHLLWRHPHLDPVMHGYGDMFTATEIQRNYDFVRLEPGWIDTLRELEVTEALVDADGKIAYALREALGWEVVVEEAPLVHLRAPADWATGADAED
ncbi:hypothetical protein [Nocardioides jishulii]|uniref:Glycosyltransferase RgtA/B/C/D-like domain-containing protein n=1 Tax=Nocardioides jishulii TaxID=2575440 RepID=A0A4U2YP64_9ACTN|nr:hypothetical protein [Nocardioides jishulii]QCX27127.1 hypothetical protein FCL41_05980 [Nocardioides jishulii]TKI61611.1 hypothetical protein FC770_12615 [Nocardioides jishulii]